MSWEDILKIKNPEGGNLIVADVNEFTKDLRAQLDVFGLKRYGQKGHKSYVVVKETWVDDETLQIVVSVRNPNTENREYFKILLREDDTGDFYYASIFGPNVTLGLSSVVDNEYQLQLQIVQGVKRILEG